LTILFKNFNYINNMKGMKSFGMSMLKALMFVMVCALLGERIAARKFKDEQVNKAVKNTRRVQ
jgi:hypothetical protein